jgi:hypothetical protein
MQCCKVRHVTSRPAACTTGHKQSHMLNMYTMYTFCTVHTDASPTSTSILCKQYLGHRFT